MWGRGVHINGIKTACIHSRVEPPHTEGGKGSGDPPLKYICVSRHFIVMRNDNGISPPALTGHTEVIFDAVGLHAYSPEGM